jgi:hypothetical protein
MATPSAAAPIRPSLRAPRGLALDVALTAIALAVTLLTIAHEDSP